MKKVLFILLALLIPISLNAQSLNWKIYVNDQLEGQGVVSCPTTPTPPTPPQPPPPPQPPGPKPSEIGSGTLADPFRMVVKRGNGGYSVNASGEYWMKPGKTYFEVDPKEYTGKSYTYFRFIVSSPGQNPLRFWLKVRDRATGEIKKDTYLGYYEVNYGAINSPVVKYLIDNVVHMFIVENYGTGSVKTNTWWW